MILSILINLTVIFQFTNRLFETESSTRIVFELSVRRRQNDAAGVLIEYDGVGGVQLAVGINGFLKLFIFNISFFDV